MDALWSNFVDFLSNKYFLLTISFGFFFAATKLRKRTGWVLLNPLLVTTFLLIFYLKVTGVSYDAYQESGKLIDFWLKPTIVAMGVPIYLQLKSIRKQLVPIIASQLVGCLVGIVSATLVSMWMGAPNDVVISLAAKSVTTPIAMEVTQSVGGISSLTAVVVVFSGLLGAVFGFKWLALSGVDMPISQGIAIGTASHALGTSAAIERSRNYGAYASMGLMLNGIFTALLTPTILRWMGLM